MAASLEPLALEVQALEVGAWKILYCVGLSPRSPHSGGVDSQSTKKLPGEEEGARLLVCLCGLI